MTPCYRLSDGWLCTGSDRRYRVRTRWKGCRRYELIGKPTRSLRVAIMRMAKAFSRDRSVKRADVIMTADYYDSVQICELVRR